MAGRPKKTEVQHDLTRRICKNLRLGMPISLAAEAENVPRATVYRWLDRFPPFMRAVTQARAQGAKSLVLRAQRGGKGAAMANWQLERRYQDDYGPPRKSDEGGKGPSEVLVTIEGGLPSRPVVVVNQAPQASSDSQEAKSHEKDGAQTPEMLDRPSANADRTPADAS